MALNTLVSLVSDQTIPNVLFANEMKDRIGRFIFITTSQMETRNKTEYIVHGANLPPEQILRVEVKEDSINDVLEKLGTIDYGDDEHFMVNLTGGTKLMSVGAYNFFVQRSSEIYYMPIGSNTYKKIHPQVHKKEFDIAYRLNLEEYLDSFGLFYESNSLRFSVSREDTFELFTKYQKKKFNRRELPEIANAQAHEVPSLRVYYAGGWFEEFVSLLLQDIFSFNENEIWANTKIYRQFEQTTPDNEFDILFILNNTLHIIECKHSLGTEWYLKTNTDNTLYKLASISKNLGLRVSSYLFTLSDLKLSAANRGEGFLRRASILGIRQLCDQSFFNRSVDEIRKNLKETIVRP